MAMILLYNGTLTPRLFQMDASINKLLHIRQTDLVWGYWALFLPGTALALCIWLFLRLSSRSPVTREILRSVGGIAAFTALPIYWLFARYASSHRYGWTPLRSLEFYELLLILVLLSLTLYWDRNSSVPLWAGVGVILLHYGFWFWQFGTYSLFFGNNSPFILLPIVGFLSAVVWLLYNRAQSQIYRAGVQADEMTASAHSTAGETPPTR